MSVNERFPVYNHYYTRGYLLNRAADGNHTVPLENKMDGFGSVGCSRTLALPVLEKIEMGKIFNCDTSSANSITSMYFYPCFSSERGKRFGIVGQTVTHPEGNFVNYRPNFFTHNYVFTPAGLKNYVEKRGLENIVSISFREKYVDESKASGAANELIYQHSVDDPLDSMLEIPHNTQISDNTGLTMNQAKALVLALTKPRVRVVVRAADDNEVVDSKARPILKMLYRWLPVKVVNNLGFITCLNGSNAHESCNLVFCNTADFQRVKRDGLPGSANSVIMYVDLVDSSSNLLPENIDINNDERSYIDWMASAICGSADPQNQQIQTSLREQENKLVQGKIDYNFVLLARIFRCISKLNLDKRATTEDLSMLLIHCFSMVYSASTISDECVSELMPLFKRSISFVKNNPDAFRSKNCDKIIIATEDKKPAVLDSVVSDLLNNGQTDIVEWINTVRVLNKDLRGLDRLVESGLLPTINPATVAELAAGKYEKGEFTREEAPLGRKIASTLVANYPNNSDLLSCCNRLWNNSVNACIRSGIRAFGGIASIDAVMSELNFLALISNHSRKTINVNCRRMIKEIGETARESELEAVNRLVGNADTLSSNFNNSVAVPEVLNCILTLCQESGSYQYHVAAKFCAIARNHIDSPKMNAQALSVIGSEFTKAIALHGDGRNLLDYAALIIENDQSRLYSFVESIAPALTVQMIAAPGSLPSDSQRKSAISALNQRKRKVVSFSIYNQFFAGITPPDVGYGKTVADTLESVPLRDINNIPISPAVFSGYNLDQNDGAKSIRRQRRAKLEFAEQKLRLTDKRSANFTDFLNKLPIDPPIDYKNKNILDDICTALEGGEDVRKTIAALTGKFEKIDVSKPMCFTNSNLARGGRLFSEYLANAKASSRTKSEEDTRMLIATSDSLRKMFDQKTAQITDTLKPAAERFRSYYSSVANCAFYGVEDYMSTQLLKLDAIPVHTSENIYDVVMSAMSSIASAKNSILSYAVPGSGNRIVSDFREKIKAVNNSLDRQLLSSLSSNDCTMLSNLLNGKQLDFFGLLFPLSCERLTKNAVELCQSDPTSKQLAPLVKEIKKYNSTGQLQNQQANSDLGYIYKEYTSRNDAASTAKTISLTALAFIVILGLTFGLVSILRPEKPELEYTCVVSDGTLLVNEEWIVCADKETITGMRLSLINGESITEKNGKKIQDESPALFYQYARPLAGLEPIEPDTFGEDPSLLIADGIEHSLPVSNTSAPVTSSGCEETEPFSFAFVGPVPRNNFTYYYTLAVDYELKGYSAEGENDIISLDEDRAALYLKHLDSLNLKYVERIIDVEVEIYDIIQQKPEEVPTSESDAVTTGSDIVATGSDVITTGSDIITTGSDVVTTGSDVLIEENPTELDVDLSGLIIKYSIDRDDIRKHGDVLPLNQEGTPDGTYCLDNSLAYSYTIRLTFTAVIPEADSDGRIAIIYNEGTEKTATSEGKDIMAAATSTLADITPTDAHASLPEVVPEEDTTPSEDATQPEGTDQPDETTQPEETAQPDEPAQTDNTHPPETATTDAPVSEEPEKVPNSFWDFSTIIHCYS